MGWSSSTTRIRFPTSDLAFPLHSDPCNAFFLASWTRRTILLLGWLALALTSVQAQARLEGVVVDQTDKSLSLRLRQDGRTVKALLRGDTRSELFVQKGDAVIALTDGSPLQIRRITAVPNLREVTRGRIHSLNPASKKLTIETTSGRTSFFIVAETAVFKDYRSANWLNLHQGQAVVVQPAPEKPDLALVILDPVSFLVRQYQPDFGRLQAAGSVVEVSTDRASLKGHLLVEDLDGKTTRLSYNETTRWHLGARFKSPEDFRDVESLVFGHKGRARMVISLRAVPFLFQSALSDR